VVFWQNLGQPHGFALVLNKVEPRSRFKTSFCDPLMLAATGDSLTSHFDALLARCFLPFPLLIEKLGYMGSLNS
jgi:hypothetical protein